MRSKPAASTGSRFVVIASVVPLLVLMGWVSDDFSKQGVRLVVMQ